MAATLTPNYGWTQPNVGGDASVWGTDLNNDLALIDAQVFANEQATVVIGSGALWFSNTPPTNWLICNGQSLATTGAYAALFAILGYAYGGSGANFNLPNFQSRFPIGASGTVALGATGGASAVTLATANLPSHAHPITDVAHNHGLPQTPHGHGDPGHTHGVNDPTHAHSASVAIQPGFGIGASFPSPMVAGGATGVTVNPAATGVSLQAAGTGIQAANANISIQASGTGLSTTQAVGSATPVPTVPPFVGINVIVRYR